MNSAIESNSQVIENGAESEAARPTDVEMLTRSRELVQAAISQLRVYNNVGAHSALSEAHDYLDVLMLRELRFAGFAPVPTSPDKP